MPKMILCAYCGKEFDVTSHDEANYYEDQASGFEEDGSYIVIAKVQHTGDGGCGEVNLVHSSGTITKVTKR